jgi:hypothetical protein
MPTSRAARKHAHDLPNLILSERISWYGLSSQVQRTLAFRCG